MAFDWKAVVSKAAPFLGTALGGPLGGAAGQLIASALGGDPTKATPDDLAKLVTSVTPEQLLALKDADQEFQLKLKALDINAIKDLQALAVQDREGARNREIQVRDKIPAVLAIGVTLGFFALLWYLLKWAPPSDNKDVLNIMLGSLGTAWISVISYYFGSSAGSANKDVLLQQSRPDDGGK